jgi:hypothetical protein
LHDRTGNEAFHNKFHVVNYLDKNQKDDIVNISVAFILSLFEILKEIGSDFLICLTIDISEDRLSENDCVVFFTRKEKMNFIVMMI